MHLLCAIMTLVMDKRLRTLDLGVLQKEFKVLTFDYFDKI